MLPLTYLKKAFSNTAKLPFTINLSLYLHFNNFRSRKSLLKLQNRLIRNQIRYIYNNSRFYRTKFKSIGLNPSMINGHDDLVKIPVLTKEEIIDNYEDIIIKKHKPYIIKTTSGSSGLALSFIRTNRENILRRLLEIRNLNIAGVNYFDKVLSIHNMKSDYALIINPFKSYHLEYDDINNALKMIEEQKINCIMSATSTLEILGEDYFKKNKKNNTLRLIISFAELLTENRRKRIEDLFNVPVFNLYGLQELPLIGIECKKREGLHINSDVIALEVIKNDQQSYDQEGRIIVTDLFNKYAPLIRYDTGDTGVLKEDTCSCGCAFPLLSKLTGRANDFLIAYNGKKVSPMEIMYLMYSIEGIKKYKIIQESLRDIVLYIVAYDHSKINEHVIRDEFQKVLPDTRIKIIYVKDDSIPQYGSIGKVKFIESKLDRLQV